MSSEFLLATTRHQAILTRVSKESTRAINRCPRETTTTSATNQTRRSSRRRPSCGVTQCRRKYSEESLFVSTAQCLGTSSAVWSVKLWDQRKGEVEGGGNAVRCYLTTETSLPIENNNRLSYPWFQEVIIDTIDVLCAQLTRDILR